MSRFLNPRWTPLLRLVTLTLVSVCGITVLLCFPPDRYAFYPRCPVYTYLHLQCPGCGTTRALAALLHGHLIDALRFNPLTILIAPVALLYIADHLRRQCKAETTAWPYPPAYAIYGLLAITTLFGIFRNLSL